MTALARLARVLAHGLSLVLPLAAAELAAARPPAPAARPAAPQGEVTARLSVGVVKLGSQVQLYVQYDGAEDARLAPLPVLDGLRLGPVGPPSSRSSIYVVNGRRTVSQSLTWVVPVVPSRKGEYTIPPLAVEAGSRRLETRPVELKVVEDLEGEELGWFEFRHPERVYEGEPFVLEMVFGWDASLGAQVNYAQLSLPWLGQLPGTLELASAADRFGRGVEIAVNRTERVAVEELGVQELGGRRLRLLRLRKRYLAARPGTLELSTSHLEFGRVTRQGFLGEQQVESSWYKRAPAFSIEVRELPSEGRPLEFTGAVGTLQARAAVDRRDLDVGDSLKLTVEWVGSANLEFFEAPDPSRLEAFRAFRVYGKTEQKSADRRVVVYDLAPSSPSVNEVPALPLWFFDTERERYERVLTTPIQIRVRAREGASGLAGGSEEERFQLDVHDIRATPLAAGELPRPGPGAILVVGSSCVLGWLLVRTAVRRGGDPASRELVRKRRAPRRLARELARARTAREQTLALARFLAARTGEEAEAWVGRDPLAWAQERAEEAALARDPLEELARLSAELDERAWAGEDRPLEAERVRALATRLIAGGL